VKELSTMLDYALAGLDELVPDIAEEHEAAAASEAARIQPGAVTQ
jgi:hypothetical protein